MRKFGIAALGLFTITLLIVSFSGHSLAATSSLNTTTVSLSPAVTNEVITPGLSSDEVVNVTNNNSLNYNYSVSVAPYNVAGEAYLPIFKALPGTTDTTSWFKFTYVKGILPADSSLSIPYKIVVPVNIKPGGYYAAVLVKVTPLKSSGGGNVISINQQLAGILFMEVPGAFSSSGQIASWQVKFLQKPPVNALLRFKNTGGIYYFTYTTVDYRNILGGLKYSSTIQHIVLPGTIRAIKVSWPSSPGYGLYKVSGQVSWDNNTLKLPTRYVLTVSGPIRVVIAVFITLGLIILARLAWSFRKNRQKNNDREAKAKTK